MATTLARRVKLEIHLCILSLLSKLQDIFDDAVGELALREKV
jgi:hypothetical protein